MKCGMWLLQEVEVEYWDWETLLGRQEVPTSQDLDIHSQIHICSKSSLLAALQLRGIDLFDETGEIAHADEHSPVPKKSCAASTSIGNNGTPIQNENEEE
ncbi:hypothetical protein COLO4_05710 [Corchorus olitorius]|uniref:Uncharacterized protein n=1 Tax=Corchorus olitorius TaxID=93759 RepID=A0A1R3KQ24_9ROSI|nr:hypothetical protein COLO4_05710 [Corchorus olitorius]